MNELRDLARNVFGVNFPGARVQPNKRDISDKLFGAVEASIDELTALATTGAQWKAPVDAASTANVVLATGAANGSVMDGFTLATGNRVLLKNQTTGSQNGVYVVQATGAPVRATDADTGTEVRGLAVFVWHGTANGGTQWISTNTGTITVGTTALTFQLLSDQSSLNASIAEIGDIIEDGNYTYEWAAADEAFGVLMGVQERRLYLPGGSIIDCGDYNYSSGFADEQGFVAFGELDGVVYGAGSGGGGSSLGAQDEANKSRAALYKTRLVTRLQRATALYNIMVVYGQSLAVGNQTWPALSRVNRYGNKQLGGNVLPTDATSQNYTPFGTAVFTDLDARTVSSAGTRVLLTEAQEAALSQGSGQDSRDQAAGEPVNHGWLNHAKFLHNQENLVENDTSRLFTTINPSIGSMTIEQLSKVNTQDSTNRYNRYLQGLAKSVDAAGASSVAVTGIMWMQGEANSADNGGSWDKASYKSLFATLIANMTTDAIAATGQSLVPVFLSYQTGGTFTRDVDSFGNPGLHVAMAQLETILATSSAYMVGPTYPVTDNGGHLDSNGSRWYGNQIAKVWHKIVRLGQDWSPVRPLRIVHVGQTITVDFHVPEPPLVFSMPYLINAAANYAAKGFKVTNAAGAVVPITSVQIVGGTIVQITCASDPGNGAHLWYADKTVHDGNGMLRDSDPTLALDTYVYEPSRGMPASANIAALVGKPYPLHNWSVAFYYPLDYSEI